MYLHDTPSARSAELPKCGELETYFRDMFWRLSPRVPSLEAFTTGFYADCLRGGGKPFWGNDRDGPDVPGRSSGLIIVEVLSQEKNRILGEMDWLSKNSGHRDYRDRYQKYFSDFKRWQQVLAATRDLVLPGMAKAAEVARKRVAPKVNELDKWWQTEWALRHKQLPAPK